MNHVSAARLRLPGLLPARLGLGLAAALIALNAQASGLSSLTNAFGNTVLATYPDGKSQRIWLRPDGSYDAIGRLGRPSAGRWSVSGDKVCLKQSKPFPVPFIAYCTSFPAEVAVGVSWTGKDLKGVPIRLSLVRGVDLPQTPAP